MKLVTALSRPRHLPATEQHQQCDGNDERHVDVDGEGSLRDEFTNDVEESQADDEVRRPAAPSA